MEGARLKVLHIGAKNYPPAHGGTERLVCDLVEGLAEVESHVLVEWGCQSPSPLVKQLPAGWLARRQAICRYARDKGIDVIHVHKSSNIPLALTLKAVGFNCVLTVHGCVWRRGERRWSPTTKALFWILDRLACTFLDRVVLVGEHDWLSFTSHFSRKRLSLIRNGVHVRGKQEPSRGSGWAYLGRISPEKNIIGLMKAAESLPEKLTLYGPVSPPNARFERLFLQELKRSNAEWKGPVPSEEVGSALSRHRVFVNPSYTEGLPFTVLEAAAEGLYLVLSDIRPHRLLGFPACSYVDPSKLDFEQLRSLPGDGGRANCLHARLNYDITETLNSYARLYAEVTDQPPDRAHVVSLLRKKIEEAL